jgi:peptide/nickel transport system permease protein
VFDWLPAGGFGASDDAASRGALAAWIDASLRLVLPIGAMAIGPLVLIARFLRESVARTAASPFADNLVAWGFPGPQRARRILRVALSPLATLVGSLLPMFVAGSIVVETVFAIDGMGRLAFEAVRANDHAMTMAVTLIGAVATLVGFVLSDLLHRALDPRVRLDA